MIVGIDIGTRSDHTAVAWLDDWNLCRIERWPLGMEYPEIIARLEPVIAESDHTYMDASGVGDPVFSTLSSPKLTGIRITGGRKATKGDIWTVPKSMLVNTLLQAVSRQKLRITAPEPGRSLLRNEMVQFTQYAGKHPKYEARAGHDDLVLSACLVVFGKLTSS